MSTSFESYLNSFSESDWLAAVNGLLPSIHAVDRNAVQIWFRFYPVGLFRYLQAAENKEEAVRGLALMGNWELKNHVDTSHHFLFGHQYWKEIKNEIINTASNFNIEKPELAGLIKSIAEKVSGATKANTSELLAISAAGLMTLVQSGLEAFKASNGSYNGKKVSTKSADAIVAERAKDDSQGIFGFLKTVDKKYSVAFSSINATGKFPIILDEEVVTASQKDKSQDWQSKDNRCWEGPVPIECTAASCGTCWIGVLGGQEKMTEVGRRERRQMKVFGYNQPADDKPFIRLACQARGEGNLTIVIPPWNGVFGKKVYGNVEEVELEPATTSAKVLRETISTATASD